MSSIPETALMALKRKTRQIYSDQLLFLLVLLCMAAINSGTRSLGLAAFAVCTSVIVDIICCVMTKKIYNPRDLSTLTSGLCLALMSPAPLSYSLIIFGSALAIGVKHIFGGKDNYIFNPTAVAFAFLIICYPGRMLLFPEVGEKLSLFTEPVFTGVSGMENLLLRRTAFPLLEPLDMLLGNFAGPVGTTHVLVILICAVCLLLRRSVSPIVTISCLSVITIFRLLFPIYDDVIGALVRELFCGYLLFALLFLANDPQTLPKSAFGKLYYGIILGFFTVIFRGGDENNTFFRGRVEGWFIFAILASNVFASRMDIVAQKVSERCVRFMETMRSRLSAYERFSEDAQSGKAFEGDITATMEIELPSSNYDMPPINNKVIKINRKKRNVLTQVIELTGSLKEKAKPSELGTVLGGEPQVEEAPDIRRPSFVIVAFGALFGSIKSFFINPDKVKKPVEPEPVQEEKPEAEEKTDKKSGVKITDFDEIAATVAEIEAKVEAEEAARKAEEERLAAIEAARIAEEERIAAEKAAAEAARKAEEERKAAEKAEADRIKAEQKAEADRIKAEQKAESDRIKAEQKAEADRIKAEQKAEADKIKAAEKAALAAQRAEAKALAREQAEKEKAEKAAVKASIKEAEKALAEIAKAEQQPAQPVQAPPVQPQPEPVQQPPQEEKEANTFTEQTDNNSEELL